MTWRGHTLHTWYVSAAACIWWCTCTAVCACACKIVGCHMCHFTWDLLYTTAYLMTWAQASVQKYKCYDSCASVCICTVHACILPQQALCRLVLTGTVLYWLSLCSVLCYTGCTRQIAWIKVLSFDCTNEMLNTIAMKCAEMVINKYYSIRQINA